MTSNFLVRSALLGLLATAPFASAHTWVEQLMAIAPNGTLVGQPGFPRGNVLRGTPGFGDPAMVNLIPPDGRPINQINPQDLMCKSTQTSQTQTDGSPRLQAAPGSAVALRFQENGHVTLPDNQPGKPQNRGTVYVYGTTQPSPDDSFLAIHRIWTPDGTGGDGRGVLLSTQNFDDGQCYQVNGGAISNQRQQQFQHPFNPLMGSDLWCQQDIEIPASAPSGKPYTLYWVWDWPTLPGTAGFPQGKQEIYTTCMDIDITDNAPVQPLSKAQGTAYQDQAVDQAAIKAQMVDISNPTAVTGTTIAFSASATGPAAGAASEASISFATDTATGVPEFLTIHTGSTAGPGIETQTFTVQPIAETGAPGQQDGDGRGGRGDGRGGRGPEVTSVPAVNNQAGVLTLTEYDSVTETVYETVYQTKYTKRDEGELRPVDVIPLPYSFPTGQSTGYIGFSWPTGRPAGFPHHPPQIRGEGSRTGRPPGNFTFGKPCNGSHGASGPPSIAPQVLSMLQPTASLAATGYIMTMPDGSIMTMPPAISSGLQNAAYITMGVPATSIQARSDDVVSIEINPYDADAVKNALPTDLSNAILDHKAAHARYRDPVRRFYPHGDSEGWPVAQDSHGSEMPPGPESGDPDNAWPSMNIGGVGPGATSSGASYQSFPPLESGMKFASSYKLSVFETYVLTTSSYADPQVTPAPSIDIRAAEPEQASTSHSAFRLRARNPFVWLGWKEENLDAEATPTIHF